MGVTCLVLLSLGLAITAQGQSCIKPVGGPNMSLKDEFILLDTFENGSKVSFSCNVGFESAGGSSTITCTAGNWSPVRLQCRRKNCGSPGEVEHGQIDFPEGIEFGDKIVITCDEGFKFVGKQGPREIFCGDQGWDDRLPVCEAVTCQPPNTSPDVSLSPIKDLYSYRDVVRFRCPSGLSLNGSNTASCLNNGSFDFDPPTCVKVQCANIRIENGEKVQGFNPTYGYQDTVTFKCKDGFKMKGASTVTCGINSQWSPALPECEVVTCKPPEKVANGTFSPVKDSYTVGNVVRYSCQRGFKLTGPNSVSCLITGTFDSASPVCTKIQCEDVEIQNGEKVGGSKPPYGHEDTVTFKCKDGFKVKGESTVTCDMNSQWSPKLPECEKIQCEDVEIPNGEKVGGSKPTYGYQETVTFKCKSGFKIKGEGTVTCDMNSQWSPKLPECEKVQCEDVKIPNGEKVGSSKPTYEYQETVTFKCKDGFKIKGESTVTCDMNSQWSPALPECGIVTCKQPKSVTNGKFAPVKDSYKYKENVEYSCDQNYNIVGSKFVTCSQDGTFAPDPPKCSYADIKDPSGHGNYIIPLVVCLVVLVVIVIVLIAGYCCGFLPFMKKCSRRRSSLTEAKKADEAVPLS